MTGEDTAVDDGVLDDVFASDRDRGGKSAPPESTPKAEPKADAPVEKPDGTDPAPEGTDPSEKRDPLKQYRDPDTGRLVPLKEVLSEREKRQEATRKLEEADKRLREIEAAKADLERQLQAARQPQFQPQQRQQPQPQKPIDWWSDPETAAAQFAQQQHMQVFETRVALSEEMMASKPDFAEMKNLFIEEARNNPMLAQQMVQHPLPAKFAYEEGRRIKNQREVGNDLEAYNKRIEEQIRAKVLEELKAGTTVNPQPQKFPVTLADATPSGSDQGAHLTDEAVMAGVFSSNRRRK